MNREVAVILALGALAVASVVVSIGSWLLLWAERRERRAARHEDPPAEQTDSRGKPAGSG